MSISSQVYHIFNNEGKLTQIEYALEAIHNSPQAISLRSDEFIVNVSKRIPKPILQEDEFSTVYKIADNIYCNITGLAADVDYVIARARELASSKEYSLGLGRTCKTLGSKICTGNVLTPDIFARTLADKFQNYIQRSGQRVPAFATMIFGFENDKASMFYTDLSAVELPCYAMCAGEDFHKMSTYLEKNCPKPQTSKKDLIKYGVSTLLQSIGREAEHTEIEVSVLSIKDGLVYLSSNEIDSVLQEIGENE